MFRNTSVSKHLRWGRGGEVFQHPPTSKNPPPPLPPLRSAFPRRPTASNGSVHKCFLLISQFYLFYVSKRRRALSSYPVLPQPPTQLPYVQLHLQAWTLRVSRFILGLIWQQLSKFLPLLQAQHKLKNCCWTVGDSAPGAMSYLGPHTSRLIVA